MFFRSDIDEIEKNYVWKETTAHSMKKPESNAKQWTIKVLIYVIPKTDQYSYYLHFLCVGNEHYKNATWPGVTKSLENTQWTEKNIQAYISHKESDIFDQGFQGMQS